MPPPIPTYNTYDMMLQLDAAILKATLDESAHVLVIRGAGENSFPPGAPPPASRCFTKSDPSSNNYVCHPRHETLNLLEQTTKARDRRAQTAQNKKTVCGGLEIALKPATFPHRQKRRRQIVLPEWISCPSGHRWHARRLCRAPAAARAPCNSWPTGRTFVSKKPSKCLINYRYEKNPSCDDVLAYARNSGSPDSIKHPARWPHQAVPRRQPGYGIPFAEASRSSANSSTPLTSADAQGGSLPLTSKSVPQFQGK